MDLLKEFEVKIEVHYIEEIEMIFINLLYELLILNKNYVYNQIVGCKPQI